MTFALIKNNTRIRMGSSREVTLPCSPTQQEAWGYSTQLPLSIHHLQHSTLRYQNKKNYFKVTCSSSPMTKPTWKPKGRRYRSHKITFKNESVSWAKGQVTQMEVQECKASTHGQTSVSTPATEHTDVFTQRTQKSFKKAFSRESFTS